MERNIQKIGLINWVILLAAALTSFLVTRYVNSSAGLAASVVIAFGFLVALIGYFQMRLEERERFEKLEFDELSRTRASGTLFSQESDTFPAQHSREQFERIVVPVFTILLFLLQGAAVYWLWTSSATASAVRGDRATVAMSLFALFALILFLFGKYASGITRLEGHRLLRAGSGYLLLGAYFSFLVTAGIAAVVGGFLEVDFYLARTLAVILGLIALETLVTLVFEIYRPRVKGRVGRLLYESRLVGLLGQPEGIIRTAAQALDYQFGFRVSDTWFYRFLERAFAWLLLLQLGILLLSTCIVFIEPGEQGLLERNGRPLRGVLEPGIHFKLPWPFDHLARYQTRELQAFTIGVEPDADKGHRERTVLWTVSHYKKEFNLLVASRDSGTNSATVPVNLLSVSIPVQYQISNVENWAYRYSNASALLEKIATREVVRYLVGVDFDEVMSSGRSQAAEDLRRHIQERADSLGLGVNILFVGLQDIHPPVAIAADYQKVIAAQQEIEAKVLAAEGYKARTLPAAQADSNRIVTEAEGYRARKTVAADARAAQFTSQLHALQSSPRVYPERAYLQGMARAIGKSRKLINTTTNSTETIQLNLEERLQDEIFDSVEVPSGKK